MNGNQENIEMKRQAFKDAFCAQYEIRQRLAEVPVDPELKVECSPEADAEMRAECARHLHPFSKDIAAGEVRVLAGTERLTYVLVARKWDAVSWLVVPFSDYSVPATEDELLMKVDGGLGTQVAQLWNARSLTTVTLSKSWLVETLAEDVVQDVVTAWQSIVGAAELSDDQRARTGWHIQRRDDVRIAYQDAEMQNFAAIDEADQKLAEKLAWVENAKATLKSSLESVREKIRAQAAFAPSPSFAPAQDYAYAAAPLAEPVSADCPVAGFDGCVHVRYTPEAKRLHLQVFGVDGARSYDLDGRAVLDGDAQMLGVIQDGDFVAEFAEGFDGRLALMDETGAVQGLKVEEK